MNQAGNSWEGLHALLLSRGILWVLKITERKLAPGIRSAGAARVRLHAVVGPFLPQFHKSMLTWFTQTPYGRRSACDAANNTKPDTPSTAINSSRLNCRYSPTLALM